MIKPIVLHPNAVLQKPSSPVKDINDPEIKGLIRDLIDTLKSREDGIGLAAPQIGVNRRIFVGEIGGRVRVFINPVITSQSNKKVLLNEGCLSVPDAIGRTSRARKVAVKAWNEQGKKTKLTLKNIEAQLIQHEIDHLDGTLFLKRAREVYRLEK